MPFKIPTRWRASSRRVVIGVIIVVFGAVAKDLYEKFKAEFKAVAASVSTYAGGPATSETPFSLVVTPTLRQTSFHGFLWFGHTDYEVVYQVRLTSLTASEGRRLPMQFNTKAGYLVKIVLPPIVRPTVIGGGAANEWNDAAHSRKTRAIGLEIDHPPPDSVTTMSVVVVSTSGFPPDSDLSVQIAFQSGIVSATGQPVTWQAGGAP